MADAQRVLTVSEVKAYYDRFGKKQDSQGFYEDPALDDIVTHGRFKDARSVFEFGCGTGKFAARILAKVLPPSATYLGCDVSPVMVVLAAQRLKAYSQRATVLQSDGTVKFPTSDHSADHLICSYVLDLLSDDDIRAFFTEAHRVLMPGGRLCVASLTNGVFLRSRIVSSLWMAAFRLHPSIVGGCRPIRLDCFVDLKRWQLAHRTVLTPFGVPSETMVLKAIRTFDNGDQTGAPDMRG